MTTPPPAPGRGPWREVWTEEEDRRLVGLVFGRGEMSAAEWEECAVRLGKRDGRVVRGRWEVVGGGGGLRRSRMPVRRLRR